MRYHVCKVGELETRFEAATREFAQAEARKLSAASGATMWSSGRTQDYVVLDSWEKFAVRAFAVGGRLLDPVRCPRDCARFATCATCHGLGVIGGAK